MSRVKHAKGSHAFVGIPTAQNYIDKITAAHQSYQLETASLRAAAAHPRNFSRSQHFQNFFPSFQSTYAPPSQTTADACDSFMAEILLRSSYMPSPQNDSACSQHPIRRSAYLATQRIHSYFQVSMASSGQFEYAPRDRSYLPPRAEPGKHRPPSRFRLQPQQSKITSASSASFRNFKSQLRPPPAPPNAIFRR